MVFITTVNPCFALQLKRYYKDLLTEGLCQNYMLHFAPLLHVCSLPQALSLLLRMSQKVGSCRLHWLTVCLNTTALALVSKVTTDFNEREKERRQETGDRRQEAGDRRQETGDRRQETGDRERDRYCEMVGLKCELIGEGAYFPHGTGQSLHVCGHGQSRRAACH